MRRGGAWTLLTTALCAMRYPIWLELALYPDMVSSMKYALEVGVRRYLGSRRRLAKCRSVEAGPCGVPDQASVMQRAACSFMGSCYGFSGIVAIRARSLCQNELRVRQRAAMRMRSLFSECQFVGALVACLAAKAGYFADAGTRTKEALQ